MQKKVEKEGSAVGPLSGVELSGQFFADQHFNLVILLITLALILAGSFVFSVRETSSEAREIVFATTPDGRLFPSMPLNKPNMTQPEILQWALGVVVQAYSLNFIDYKKTIRESRNAFTDIGYRQYLKAITESNMINSVITEKYVVLAKPTGAPIITKEALLPDGFYAWQIQMPLEIIYESSVKQSRQNLVVTVTVERVSEEESEEGIAIATFLARQGKI